MGGNFSVLFFELLSNPRVQIVPTIFFFSKLDDEYYWGWMEICFPLMSVVISFCTPLISLWSKVSYCITMENNRLICFDVSDVRSWRLFIRIPNDQRIMTRIILLYYGIWNPRYKIAWCAELINSANHLNFEVKWRVVLKM